MSHDKIQILNCVMVYFNVRKNEKLVNKMDLQLCGALK